MSGAPAIGTVVLLALGSTVVARQVTNPAAAAESYLAWSAAQAEMIGKQAFQRGRVGGRFDTRLLKTERSYNYKLAATWLTPEVIRASARLLQLQGRLNVDQTRALVSEAEAVGGTVIMIEIDPREGSGVIPVEWQAFLQPRGDDAAAMAGVNSPHLRTLKALSGVLRRNYDYDRFWMVFPADATAPYLQPSVQVAELVVRIHNHEGRVQWPVPPSLKRGARPPFAFFRSGARCQRKCRPDRRATIAGAGALAYPSVTSEAWSIE